MTFIPDSAVMVKAEREQMCLLKGRAKVILTAGSVVIRKGVEEKCLIQNSATELTQFYCQSNKKK